MQFDVQLTVVLKLAVYLSYDRVSSLHTRHLTMTLHVVMTECQRNLLLVDELHRNSDNRSNGWLMMIIACGLTLAVVVELGIIQSSLLWSIISQWSVVVVGGRYVGLIWL